MFARTMDRTKGKYYAFNGYKQRNNVCFVHLVCKVQKATYG